MLSRIRKGAWTYLWVAYLIFGGGLTCSYFLFPTYALALWAALGGSAALATVVGIRRHRPRKPAAWYLLAAAQLSFVSADTSYNVLTQIMGQEAPFPSVADPFYLLTYLFIAAGLFLIIRARSSTRDFPSLIDAVIITTGLGLLSWVYLIVPNFQADGLEGLLEQITAVAAPLGDIMILAMLARLMAGGGLRIRSMHFLVIGAMGILGADAVLALRQLHGTWTVGTPVDLGWAVFYLAWGAAALHPSMRRLTAVAPLPSIGAGRVRITLLACASLIAPVVLFIQGTTHKDTDASTVAVFSALLFILVLARMSGIVGAHKQLVRREQALRTSSEALVAAQGLPEIYQAALAGVTSLIGSAKLSGARVYLADSDGVQSVASSGTVREVRDDGAIWVDAQAGGHLSQSGAVSVNPLRYDFQDLGMLITEGKAALTVDQHLALATLASQVAIAVASANLGEELRQRQSQEQFRSMIQNASDIIIVVDEAGRITYGTPSLERELGHPLNELVGTALTDLLRPEESAMAAALISGIVGGASQTPSIADWHLRHADGRYLIFEVLTSNLLDTSSVSGIVLTMRDVSQRHALEEQLTHQAFHDTLTGLPNRALFQDRVEHALSRAARRGTAVAMAMVDLDDFKEVNDTRGHAAGDVLLGEVARRLQQTLRASTTIARLGGDEFAILIEDLEDGTQARGFTERVLQPFRTPFTLDGEQVTVSASIGLVISGGDEAALDVTELLRCADLALYAAKERGKGRVERYHDELHTRMVNRLTQRSDLSQAMEAEQFELHYQPVILIETGEIIGSEALIRWRHPTRGLVMPGEFIDLAEEVGHIVELGAWVIARACAQWREWADQGHASHRVAVNVSARQLQEADFADHVRSVMLRHAMPPTQLVLELTESTFALDAPTIREQLNALRDVGVQIAVDDFGTGYSSLSYLQQFQVDVLKIDKAFVDGLGTGNPEDGALATAIVSMARSLRLDVVAEGIETKAQRDALYSMGCEVGQGYLYSKPVPPEELLRLLTQAEPLGNPATNSCGPNIPRPPVPTTILRIQQEPADASAHPTHASRRHAARHLTSQD